MHILYASGKFENSITGILVYHFDYLGSTRKITDKAGKINYNAPLGLSPRHILAPYANVAHDILNIASIVGGVLRVIPLIGGMASNIVSLALLVLCIMGIARALRGSAEPLPVIGDIHLIG